MKPAWPQILLSRWSKRLLRGLSLFIASAVLATGLSVPAQSAWLPDPPVTDRAVDVLLAQNTIGNAILYFETPTFTVSVHPRGAQALFMNVYNRSTGQSEQLNAPTTARGPLSQDGWVSYDSFGSRTGRNVIYRASGNRNAFQARLEIIDAANGSILLSQNSTLIRDFLIPAGTAPEDDLLARTLVAFQTQNHSVRVFTENGLTKMNVFNNRSRQQLVNGQIATADLAARSPYQCWTSYFSFSNQGGGTSAVRYYVRVSPDGQALLQILDGNDIPVLTEPRITAAPLITNIPESDRPDCFGDSGRVSGALAPFVAAVFGNDSDLRRVQEFLIRSGAGRSFDTLTCVVDPRFESARQGRFINAAECNDRNHAAAVVSLLMGEGFNSRLVFRSVRYR